MRKVSVSLGVALLVIAEVLSIAVLFVSTITKEAIAQALLFLISMVIIWYVAHPISHYTIARIFGVPTMFFFLGPSDIGKSGPSLLKKLAPLFITIGTKLDYSKLVLVSGNRRAWIFGSGALIGVLVLALLESIAILSFRFNEISLVLGGLIFLLTIGTELVLSTKSGDLSKMKKELVKAKR